MTKGRYLEAVGLGFTARQDGPPVVTAQGEMELAAQIVALARRHGVPVVEKPELCEALSSLPLDEEIPAELFEAAAVVLGEVGRIPCQSRIA